MQNSCPRSSVVEHFFGKEEVKGPILFVGLESNQLKSTKHKGTLRKYGSFFVFRLVSADFRRFAART